MINKLKIGFFIVGVFAFAASCGDNPKENGSAKKEIVPKSMNAEKLNETNTLTPQQKLGKRLFIMCEACHNVKKGEPHKVGPNLHGVFGRKAGTEPGFNYSEAVLKTDLIWSDKTIRSWLKDPNDYIPGTNMVFVGLQKERQQDALLSYLYLVTE